MKCSEIVEILSEYLERELEPELQSKVDHHMQDCSECSGILEEYRFFVKELGAVSLDPREEDFSRVKSLQGKIKDAVHETGDIMTLVELSNYLKISESEILENLSSLPHFELGENLRFNKGSIQEWIKNQERRQSVSMAIDKNYAEMSRYYS